MNELERARFDLEMIQPYVAFLKEKIAKEEGKIRISKAPGPLIERAMTSTLNKAGGSR